jgi:hypothetical protein
MKTSRRSVLRAAPALAGGALAGRWVRRALAQAALAQTQSQIRMVNGAPAAGLDFVLRNGAFGRKYQVDTLPGGLGVIDFDGDGWPDLFCTNGAALPKLTKSGAEYWSRLYRNNRDGTFSDVTAKALQFRCKICSLGKWRRLRTRKSSITKAVHSPSAVASPGCCAEVRGIRAGGARLKRFPLPPGNGQTIQVDSGSPA